MLSKDQKEYVSDYYYASLEEMSYGTTREQILIALGQFEEAEDYLACAGIKKAIEFLDIQELTLTISDSEQLDNIKFIDGD